MQYFAWFITFAMVVAAVVFRGRVRQAINAMQADVNAQRDPDQRLVIRFSWDQVRVIEAYRRDNPGGRHLIRYRLSLFAFFMSIILAAAALLINAWYLNPVAVTPDRPYMHDNAAATSGEGRDWSAGR